MENKQFVVIAYVPVLHEGYLRLFKRYPGELYLIGGDILNYIAKDTPYYGRDIRALPAALMARVIESLAIFKKVSILDKTVLAKFSDENTEIIMPDEDISEEVKKRWLVNNKISLDSIFLRWDHKITEREFEVKADWVVSDDTKDKDFIAIAQNAAEKSSDWWRQIGAVAVKGGEVLYEETNRHMPDQQSPYVVGDPKNNYDVGQGPNYYTSIHAEAAVVARAAKDGKSLLGASVYVTVFPCPNCARLLREAGVKKVYFAKGHSALDAEDILKGAGVELVYVPAPKS